MWPMKVYVWRWKATIEYYIGTRPIYELCNGVERIQGSSWILRWWDQDHSWEEEGNGSSGGVDGDVE